MKTCKWALSFPHCAAHCPTDQLVSHPIQNTEYELQDWGAGRSWENSIQTSEQNVSKVHRSYWMPHILHQKAHAQAPGECFTCRLPHVAHGYPQGSMHQAHTTPSLVAGSLCALPIVGRANFCIQLTSMCKKPSPTDLGEKSYQLSVQHHSRESKREPVSTQPVFIESREDIQA